MTTRSNNVNGSMDAGIMKLIVSLKCFECVTRNNFYAFAVEFLGLLLLKHVQQLFHKQGIHSEYLGCF